MVLPFICLIGASMNLGELSTYVATATGRIDKLAFIKSAINASCRTVAGMQDNYHDRVEDLIAVSPDTVTHELITPPNLRKIEYIKATNSTVMCEPRSPKNMYSNGVTYTNVYYRVGSSIIVHLDIPATELVLGYLSIPAVLIDDTDTNWLIGTYGTLIGDLAIGKVLRLTGDVNSAKAIEASSMLELEGVLQDLAVEGTLSV